MKVVTSRKGKKGSGQERHLFMRMIIERTDQNKDQNKKPKEREKDVWGGEQDNKHVSYPLLHDLRMSTHPKEEPGSIHTKVGHWYPPIPAQLDIQLLQTVPANPQRDGVQLW